MNTKSNQFGDPYSSSSSSSPPWAVFLSFHGKDTRTNFVKSLYNALVQAGIRTFRDENSLEFGEEISSGLHIAIRNSKKFIVVLSKNYARSSWCLNELVDILGCETKKNQVFPVFYYVDPSVVRYQQGSFGEALEFHKKHYSIEMIENWKSALSTIAGIKGYHLKKNANLNESIQEIVENVARQASPKVLNHEEYLFGMDSAVKDIYLKLNMDSNDVRAIGICGEGGIGKTTTAKAFYNKYFNKFDISCFTENVKQNLRGSSLLLLLEQLMSELLRRNDYKVPDVERGIKQLKQILWAKKALIVLDDLDQSTYSELLVRLCNSFSAGSKIIITTRDANPLKQLKVDTYKVKGLGHIDSLELFSYNAFGKPMPPASFKELSERLVTYNGGIPLTLKVLGSSLCGRNHVSFWKQKLEKVIGSPGKEMQKVLQLSYDLLEDEIQKRIFLDIVFFFVGRGKDEAVHVLKSCGFNPEFGIPILVERGLLTIDNNKYQMHNLIQHMGREAIQNEGRHLYLGQRNACEILQNLEGTDKIEGLVLDLTMSTDKQINGKIFERLPNLRLLEIIDAHEIHGNLENSFPNLRCIRWHHCPQKQLPSSFRPQNLVFLDMPFGESKTPWKSAKPIVSLKIKNLSYSVKLKTTPDFTNFKAVEKLFFRGCESLSEVHPSIGQLTDLNHLDFSECVSLERLPNSVKHLINLGILNMKGCSNMTQLPEILGDMEGLKMLDVSCTAIEVLPDSIVRLKQLDELRLHSCIKLRKLPEQFGNLEGLRKFDASCSALEQLPKSFGDLINLVELDLRYCKNLRYLPSSILKLKLLKYVLLSRL